MSGFIMDNLWWMILVFFGLAAWGQILREQKEREESLRRHKEMLEAVKKK